MFKGCWPFHASTYIAECWKNWNILKHNTPLSEQLKFLFALPEPQCWEAIFMAYVICSVSNSQLFMYILASILTEVLTFTFAMFRNIFVGIGSTTMSQHAQENTTREIVISKAVKGAWRGLRLHYLRGCCNQWWANIDRELAIRSGGWWLQKPCAWTCDWLKHAPAPRWGTRSASLLWGWRF